MQSFYFQVHLNWRGLRGSNKPSLKMSDVEVQYMLVNEFSPAVPLALKPYSASQLPRGKKPENP